MPTRKTIFSLGPQALTEDSLFEHETGGVSGNCTIASLRAILLPSGVPSLTTVNTRLDSLEAAVSDLLLVYGNIQTAEDAVAAAEAIRIQVVTERGVVESVSSVTAGFRNAAEGYANAAFVSREAASVSQGAAAASASSAAASAVTATAQATEAQTAATASASSASSALASQNAAASSSAAASTSALNAATSASNASTSETNSAASATTALGASASSSTSATNAANSATAAGGSASAAATSASNAATSSTAAGSSASAANTSRIAAETANTNAQSAASAASGSAASATASAATATTQAILSSTFATNSLNSLRATKPRGMSGGADWYTGSAGWNFGTDGSVPVINATGGGAMDVYPKWAYIASPGRTYKLHLHARASSGTRSCFFAYGNVNTDVNPPPTYTLGVGSMVTFDTSYSIKTAEYTVPASPASPFLFFFFNIQPESGALYVRDFWVEDITALVEATAQATIATTQATSATAQAAAASASAVLSASIGLNSLNKNPVFADWTGGSGTLPADWSDWINGTANTRVAGDLGGYAFQQTNTLGVNFGLAQNPTGIQGKVDGSYFVLEAEVTLVSGTLVGAGVYIAKTGWDALMPFSTTPDSTGAVVGAGTTGRRYTFRKLVSSPTNGNTSWAFYCMTSWGGFDPTMPVKTLKWHRCSIRPATPQEIESATVLAPLSATVSTHSSAIALLNGYTEARWVTTAVAGSGRAQLAIFANANGGGGVDIVGDVKIDGDLLVTGSVSSSELAANSASLSGFDTDATGFALTTSWQDAAEVTLSMIGGVAKIDFGAFVGGKGESSGSLVQWRLLRNGTEIKSGTLCLLPGEQTVYGGTVGENPYPVYTPITGMFPAFHLDTSGATGSVTYKIQVKLSTAFVDYATIAEIFMTATELRR